MRVTDAEVREAMDTYKAASEYGQYFGGDARAMRAVLEAFLVARTTARAPEPKPVEFHGFGSEPTEAEIEAGARALHNFTQEPSGQDRPWENFPVEYHDLFRERARVVLIAARSAREGGA